MMSEVSAPGKLIFAKMASALPSMKVAFLMLFVLALSRAEAMLFLSMSTPITFSRPWPHATVKRPLPQ